jgi:hypothetical protein
MPYSSADELRLSVEAPEQIASGRSVPIALRVENVTERTMTLYLTGRPVAFDLVVDTAEGARVWSRLEGAVIQSILRLETLEPGGELVLDDAWDQRSHSGEQVRPGDYLVRGTLLVEGGQLASAPRELRILPP